MQRPCLCLRDGCEVRWLFMMFPSLLQSLTVETLRLCWTETLSSSLTQRTTSTAPSSSTPATSPTTHLTRTTQVWTTQARFHNHTLHRYAPGPTYSQGMFHDCAQLCPILLQISMHVWNEIIQWLTVYKGNFPKIKLLHTNDKTRMYANDYTALLVSAGFILPSKTVKHYK